MTPPPETARGRGETSQGPWYVGELELGGTVCVYSAEAKLVATLRQYPGFPDAEADGALIAAAPELLEALREVVEVALRGSTSDGVPVCCRCWAVSTDGKAHSEGCEFAKAHALLARLTPQDSPGVDRG